MELGAGGEVVSRTGREVVDYVHLVPALEQSIDDMRTDEARATCHERPHAHQRGFASGKRSSPSSGSVSHSHA